MNRFGEPTLHDLIAVIVNAHAGGKYDDAWAQQLTQQFLDAGLTVSVTLASDGDTMVRVTRDAVASGARIVVAGGGDGTINAVASALAGSACALGVLPLGTLNHFAKDLGIPLAVNEAIACIAAGNVRLVDTGEVNDTLFLNNSGLGMYPDIVRDREHQQQRLGRGKWLAFASATISALRRYPFLTVRLTIDGKEQVHETPFIFIGNNVYSMSGFTLGTRTTLDDGLLSLYITERTSRIGLVGLALRSLVGRLQQARDFNALVAREMVIETRHRRLPVATDGEVNWMNTPLHYRIRPGALRVLAPIAPAADNAPH